MTINKQKSRPKILDVGEDILGAGMHILSGAGGDLKMLVQQTVQRIVGDAYVSKAEYEKLLARVAALEGKNKKPSKSAPKKSASKKPANRRK